MCHWLCFGQTNNVKCLKLGDINRSVADRSKGGSVVELPRAVGLIVNVICLFHPPTTMTNVLKLIQALQEIFSLVHNTLKVCSLTCELPSPIVVP